jgi:hypothetical protein
MEDNLHDIRNAISAHRELLGAEGLESFAHTLWIERGSREGSPEVDWFEAERRLNGADEPGA